MTKMIKQLIDRQKRIIAAVRELREKRGSSEATNFRTLAKKPNLSIASRSRAMKNDPTEKAI